MKMEFIPYPDDPRIGVSKCGQLYNYKTKKLLKQHVIKTGYYNVVITSPGIVHKAYRVHRVILKTFLPVDNSDYYFVNHIDGNKLNNDLDNLEWVTPLGNVEHAINNDLWTTLKPIQRRNVLTGEVIIKRSIRQMALEDGINLATLSKHLLSENAGSYEYNGFTYRYICETPWPSTVKRQRASILVKCVNIMTNELHVFDNMVTAAKFCNINYRRLNHHLVTRGDKTYKHNHWHITL